MVAFSLIIFHLTKLSSRLPYLGSLLQISRNQKFLSSGHCTMAYCSKQFFEVSKVINSYCNRQNGFYNTYGSYSLVLSELLTLQNWTYTFHFQICEVELNWRIYMHNNWPGNVIHLDGRPRFFCGEVSNHPEIFSFALKSLLHFLVHYFRWPVFGFFISQSKSIKFLWGII